MINMHAALCVSLPTIHFQVQKLHAAHAQSGVAMCAGLGLQVAVGSFMILNLARK